jgi:hypothetical protein
VSSGATVRLNSNLNSSSIPAAGHKSGRY